MNRAEGLALKYMAEKFQAALLDAVPVFSSGKDIEVYKRLNAVCVDLTELAVSAKDED